MYLIDIANVNKKYKNNSVHFVHLKKKMKEKNAKKAPSRSDRAGNQSSPAPRSGGPLY